MLAENPRFSPTHEVEFKRSPRVIQAPDLRSEAGKGPCTLSQVGT